MIGIERCREILGEVKMTNSEIEKLRESLYSIVESILDNYFKEGDKIDVCRKQLSTVEFPLQSKVQMDTDLIVKNIGVENMLNKKAMKL